jgi:hypothetical protein
MHLQPTLRRAATGSATAIVTALTVVLAGGAADGRAKQPYTATPGPEVADASFAVRYEGAGSYRTRFDAHPPNPDAKDDQNSARDSSRQAWDVTFARRIAVPTCGQPADGGADPCEAVTGLTGARGHTSITGRVNHKHVDGIYRQLDRTVKCRLAKRPSAKRRLDATLAVRYLPESQSFGVRALSPLVTAASLFPAQCAKQGDSIDRILDFYAMPGFSFADSYGPERWFSSREVVIPATVFHRSSKIRIPLEDTPAGTPPRDCAVHDPSFERCRTGGSWSGVVTLTRKQAAGTTFSAARTAAKVTAPKSGSMYHGRPGKLQIYISGKTIQIVAFQFQCKKTTGATSLSDIKLTKSRRGYRFGIKAHGIVTYRDDHADENGTISISGRFSRTAKSAGGSLRVRTPRCGDTGTIEWRAKR